MAARTFRPPPITSVGMAVELWPIARPIPYAKNARKWDQRAVEKVAASIREFGFVQPIVCDRDDVIVIGHLRLDAARFLELAEVPVHVAANLPPEKVKALRIADNRTHEEAEWINDMLGVELLELKALPDFDVALTGFDVPEIIESVFGSQRGKRKNGGASKMKDGLEFRVVVDCTGEDHQAELLARFKVEGLKCRALIS